MTEPLRANERPPLWATLVATSCGAGLVPGIPGHSGQATGVPDDQRIVVDEVAGYLATIMFVPRSWPNLIVGFFLFRLLDVWKPGPIGVADEWLTGGVGVMADDLVAGVIGAFIMVALWYSGAIPFASAKLMALVHPWLVRV